MKKISIELDENEAIVLFEYLNGLSEKAEGNAAERVVINSIICDLEKKLPEPFDSKYEEILRNARKSVESRG